ncbi:MAG: YeeE/YedE thiosulfate transporter family protein [Solirubrobacteraceae bacterium]|nr:YeeE/YedE thiosulfate transporter family protein [Solirubrobacteraceae bacterium]
MSTRVAAAIIGVVFGVVLSWSGMTSPEIIRAGLLFQDPYLLLFFAGAMLTALVGLRILRARAPRALLTGEPVDWEPVAPERRHVVGSALFGVGWGVAGVCPGPIATQLGQGIAWGVPTTVGLVLGIVLFGRLQRRSERARGRTSPRRAGVIPSPVAADASA